MYEGHGAAERDNGGQPFHVGQAVALARGKLAGLTGIVERFGPNSRCLIRLDGFESSVFVRIDAALVQERGCEAIAKHRGVARATPHE
jgi:hypothetical protein